MHVKWIQAPLMTLSAAMMIAGVATAAPVGSMDRMFAVKAAQGGIAEVSAARIAERKAIDGGVRDFAQRMRTDHSQANRDLTRIASGQGIALPMSTDAKHRMQLARLESFSGPQFDRVYMKGQVADHVATVALFQREARWGRNPALRSFAARMLPALKSHKNMSFTVAESLNPNMRAGIYAHRRHRMAPM